MSSIKVHLKRVRTSLSDLALGDLFVLAQDGSIGDRVFVRGLLTPDKQYQCICIFSNNATIPEYRHIHWIFTRNTLVVRVVFDGDFIVEV